MIICGIYDTKQDAVLTQVFTTNNEMTARRMFKNAPLERIGLEIVRDNPEDFYLVKLADFDQDKTGSVSPDSKRLFCFSEVVQNG